MTATADRVTQSVPWPPIVNSTENDHKNAGRSGTFDSMISHLVKCLEEEGFHDRKFQGVGFIVTWCKDDKEKQQNKIFLYGCPAISNADCT